MARIEQNEAVRFLLGKLSDEEQAEIEEGFFADRGAFDDLLIAENDLTDDYVAGRLLGDDRQLYEGRLLLSNRQIERLRFASALIRNASRLPREETPSTGGWLAAVKTRFALRSALIGFAAMAVVLLSLSVWRQSRIYDKPEQATVTSPSTGQPPLPAEPPVRTPSTDTPPDASPTPESKGETKPYVEAKPAPPAPKPVIATIALPLISARDLSAGSKYVISPRTTAVDLQFEIEPGGNFTSYFARVETLEGRQVWHGPVAKRTASAISLRVPARRLGSGYYIVTLKGLRIHAPPETVGEYAFSIDRGR